MFHRLARRDKKAYCVKFKNKIKLKKKKERKEAFLSDQCKEIEESKRMGKTRDPIKKICNTKATFHAKMGSVKDKNCMDLRDAEDTKKRWQEYRVELFKKGLQDPDSLNEVIPHLEPDILECEVKWAIERITKNNASRGY